MSNRAEYIAGTDPTNSASYLRIEHGIIPNAASVRVTAVANRTYTLQYTDDLNSGLWRKLADLPAQSIDRVESRPDPAWTSNRLYRVVTPWQP
jgi:hypothetical protein